MQGVCGRVICVPMATTLDMAGNSTERFRKRIALVDGQRLKKALRARAKSQASFRSLTAEP